MITWTDLQQLANIQKVSPFVIMREYLQILFLNHLYSLPTSEAIVFKGGTCLRLVHNSNRFSEDLDFTTSLTSKQLENVVSKTVDLMVKETNPIIIKTVASLAGFTQKLSMATGHSPVPLSIKLDFSQREKVWLKDRKPITSNLPISTFSSIVYMEMTEILAEKCRALCSRHKGRDIYDLWYLLQRKTPVDLKLIQKKFDYYEQKFDQQTLLNNINSWEYKKFDLDVRGFLPESDRKILPAILPSLKSTLTFNP